MSSGGGTARENEQWTAGGRRAPVQTRQGRKQLLLLKDVFPLAEKYRYLPYDSLFEVTNFEFSRAAQRRPL